MNRGFLAGAVIGGLIGAYYGYRMTTRERSEFRNMAVRLAARGRRALSRAGARAERAMESAADMLVD